MRPVELRDEIRQIHLRGRIRLHTYAIEIIVDFFACRTRLGITVGMSCRGSSDDRQRECDNEHCAQQFHNVLGVSLQTESVLPIAYFSQTGLTLRDKISDSLHLVIPREVRHGKMSACTLFGLKFLSSLDMKVLHFLFVKLLIQIFFCNMKVCCCYLISK